MTTIALDFDGTYTLESELWNRFIDAIDLLPGVRIVICTYRDDRFDEHEALKWLSTHIPVYFTRGVAKKFWMQHFGEPVDIWIDDKPESILENSQADPDWLEQWRTENEEAVSNRKSEE